MSQSLGGGQVLVQDGKKVIVPKVALASGEPAPPKDQAESAAGAPSGGPSES